MTKSKDKRPVTDPTEPTPLTVLHRAKETPREAMARMHINPATRHASIMCNTGQTLKEAIPPAEKPGLAEYVGELTEKAKQAKGADLTSASELLAVQAVTLDALFTECATRSLHNLQAGYGDAADRYMRMALKAQGNSRATIEALAKLHQPREQTVRHVHVNEGGQAVIDDNFHHHTGGRNESFGGQPQATGAGAAGPSAALPCPDPIRSTLPIPCRERKQAMQNARRQRKRSA